MFLILLLFVASLALEGIGTYISVLGLAATFAADPIILTMAVVLDFCKIIAVSTLAKRWTQLSKAIRVYLVAATLVLMTITSGGVGGYLSNSFQKAMLPNQGTTIVLDNTVKEQTRLLARKKEIDDQISKLPANNVRGRERLQKSFKEETDHVNSRLIEIDSELPKLQNQEVKGHSDVGSIIFLANSFGVSPETAVGYVILLIIGVFDPLSIIFLITANRLWIWYDEQKKQAQLDKLLIVQPTPLPEPEIIDEEPIVEEPIKIEPKPSPVFDIDVDALMKLSPDPVPSQPEEIVEEEKPVLIPQFSVVEEPKSENIIDTFDGMVKKVEDPTFEIPKIELAPVLEKAEEIIKELPKETPVQPEENLESILKQLFAGNNDGSLTDEEKIRLNKALDKIFQPTPNEPEAIVDEDDSITPPPIVDVPVAALVEPAEVEQSRVASSLDNPLLDSMPGSGSEFVGPMWINPKLLEIYDSKS